MSASTGSPPPRSLLAGTEGRPLLPPRGHGGRAGGDLRPVAGSDDAASGPTPAPGALGTARARSCRLVDGRPVADVVDARPAHRAARRRSAGRSAPAARRPRSVVRPLRVATEPGRAGHPRDRRRPRPTRRSGPDIGPTSSSRRSSRCSRRPCRCCPTCACRAATTARRSARAAGGDWYDAVPLGARAAGAGRRRRRRARRAGSGAMSRLRGAMRSTAAARSRRRRSCSPRWTPSPRRWTTSRARRSSTGLLDAATGRLAYAAAGHPAAARGAAGRRHGVPAGRAAPAAGQRCRTPRPPCREDVLDQGATLVLFSNGAVAGAARGPARTALDRLADVARGGAQPAPGAAGRRRVRRAGRGHRRGRARPRAGGPTTSPCWSRTAGPASWSRCGWSCSPCPPSLPGVRRRLAAWLAGLGMGEQDRVGVMVAVGEACANAAEHAYRGQPSPGRCRCGAASTSTACSP